jgi:hypothetical protein
LYNKTQTTLVAYPTGKTGNSFTIPNSVTSIGDGAFYYCTNLASIIIPNSVTAIGEYAFYYSTSLASITIPASVISIGNRAFSDCDSLASVTFEGTIASGSFNTDAFRNLGDLRAKFYETNSSNGTPGTYTRTAPLNSSSVWTKQ